MKPSTRWAICHRALWKPDAIKLGMGAKCARRAGHHLPRKRARSKGPAQGTPLFDLETL